jgi:putative SOS response-associated peptidase YedK
MIERYSISASGQAVNDRFHVDVPGYYKPRYNAAPTQLLPVITSESPQGISLFYWGRPPLWARNKSLSERIINLHVENLNDRPVLKKALMKFRCIIPADGFYAWKKIGKKTSIPYRVITNQELFSFAALWEEFEDETGSVVHTFNIITTEANDTLKKITERMPLILTRESEKIWLAGSSTELELLKLLEIYPADRTSMYPVSPRINEIKNDAPSLLIPTPPADQFGNLTLFD